MQLNNTFEVKQPADAVWAAFADVHSVAQCLPGADLVTDKGDGVYEGSVQVKLGPMAARFEGEATVTRDDATRTGHIEGRGVDRGSGSRGQIKVEYAVTAVGDGTSVTVDAEISLAGAIARFGRSGLVEEITRRLVDEFVEYLEAKMSAGTVEEAASIEAGDVKGFSLLFRGLLSWIGKFFKRLFRR